MTHEELDRLWFQAMEESIKDGEMVARYHFAALVAAAEREACAKVALSIDDQGSVNQRSMQKRIVRAIRARSST